MGNASGFSQAKKHVVAGILGKVSESQVETLEILMDIDQMTQLMTGLLEVRSGQVVSFEQAFSDMLAFGE